MQFPLIAAMFGLLYFGTLYAQQVLGYRSLQARLGFVLIAVVIAGVSIGLTVLSAFVTARTAHLTASGSSNTDALLGGYHVAFLVAAWFVLAGLVGAVVMLRAHSTVTVARARRRGRARC